MTLCHRKTFFVRKRSVPLPIGSIKAKSQKRMCGKCFKKVMEALKTNQPQ